MTGRINPRHALEDGILVRRGVRYRDLASRHQDRSARARSLSWKPGLG